MTDERIIKMYFDRDTRAISHTQTKYGAFLQNISRNITGSNEDAEECENDTYSVAWNTIPPQRPRVLAAFLAKIIRNLSFKRLRAGNAQKRGGGESQISLDELEYCIPDNSFFKDTLEERELARSIDKFLSTLSVTERKVFVCRYWYCDSIADICKQLGYGESKVKMILLRTREKLRKHLEKEGYFI